MREYQYENVCRVFQRQYRQKRYNARYSCRCVMQSRVTGMLIISPLLCNARNNGDNLRYPGAQPEF